MKQRFKLILAYDGTAYVGWQHQQNGISIQEKLANALRKINKSAIRPIGSGRTDAGVHALAQVAHVDLEWRHTAEELRKALNSLLPADIQIHNVEAVTKDFHAQKSAREKWYRYAIYQPGRAQQAAPLLFERAYAWQVDYPLKIAAMRQAARILMGRHDFASFQGSGASVKTTVRHLKRIKITRAKRLPWPRLTVGAPLAAPMNGGHWLFFDFIGEGFLKQMVRNLVGTLVEVGQGKLNTSDVKRILKAKDRKKAGHCAPPLGLYLMRVSY